MHMIKFVNVTSQGQITIPAAFRRALGITKEEKVQVSLKGKQMIIEPPADITKLFGSLSKYAIKNKSIDEVIAMEEEAWGNAVAEDYIKKFGKK